MSRTVRHLVLGVTTGVTVFAIVIPLIHLAVELVAFAGVAIGTWDSLIEVFVFLVTAAMVGIFPWGLWIVLTDARKVEMFDEGRDVAAYSLAAICVYVTLTLLVCTRLQGVYAQFRWFLTPALLICAAALIRWRWTKLWMFPTKGGIRGALDCALALRGVS